MVDLNVLRSVFASRVALAKMPVHEAIQQAEAEWHRTQKWVISQSNQEGSFNWFCQEFDLDESAVRRAIKERK
jgi:hypothetical protein